MTAEEFKSLNVINGKWKSLIIYNLSDGRKRFTHLLRLTSGISQKVLCENLKDLENDNLIGKEYFYEYPPRVEYFLTNKGYTKKDMLKSGLMGMECYHSNFTNEEMAYYLEIANRYNLLVSGGSDYHGSAKPDVSLGTGKNNNLYIRKLSILDRLK